MCLTRLSKFMARLRDRFIFNSDYPIDKIVWLKEGQVQMQLGSTGDDPIEIAHDLGVQLYVNGVWTIDNWATTYTFNASRIDGQGYAYQSLLAATASKVYLSGQHAQGGTSTFKYRLWGFLSEDATKGIPAKRTAGWSGNKLVLSTDHDYPMLCKEGVAAPGTTITHALGDIPYVDVWGRSPYTNYGYSTISNDSFGRAYGMGELVQIDSQKILFRNDSTQYDSYYYRIYMP